MTGKYNKEETPTEGRFSAAIGNNFGVLYQDRYWHDRQFQTVSQLDEIAKSRGVPLTTLSVAWVLANPTVTAAILGASRLEQLDDSLAATSYSIDPELKKQLDELTAEYRRGDAIVRKARCRFIAYRRPVTSNKATSRMSRPYRVGSSFSLSLH